MHYLERVPVELTIFFSSKGIPGKGVGSDPVAIMEFLKETVVWVPSLRLTFKLVALAKLPVPFKYVTLFFEKSPSIPLVRPVTILPFFSWTLA